MSEVYVGTIVATTTKNNSDTATPFTLNAGGKYAVQSDAAMFIRSGASASATATTTTGVRVDANVLFDIDLPANHAYIAAVAVSGTANVRVFARTP